jgi:DNA-binding HxlR family transcriptional regulator
MNNVITTTPLPVLACEEPCSLIASDVAKFQGGIKLLSGKWKVEILAALISGPRRFGDLKRALPGVTQHMLTTKLRELAKSGLVKRTAFNNEAVLHVEYELTDAAYGLAAVFEAMIDWANRLEC